MKQKLLILLCALMASITASAYDFAYDYNGKTLYFKTTGDLTCALTRQYYYMGYSGDIIIPSTVYNNGVEYTVTSIDVNAFNEDYISHQLESVELPNTITNIQSYAFSNCQNLKYVKMSNTLKYIGAEAFYCCNKLESIELPNTLISIGARAFSECSKLTYIYIPFSVTTIGQCAFEDCRGLESFAGKFVSDDNRCLIIEGEIVAFAPANITSYETPITANSIGYSAFSGCHQLQSIKILESIVTINTMAFYCCSNLTSVEISSSVNSIRGQAFEGCKNLSSIKIYNPNPSNIETQWPFDDYIERCILYVPFGSKELYESISPWSSFKDIIEFGIISLQDGESYTSTENLDDAEVTYTRTFNNTEWQPLYVPFNMSYDEWSAYADVAELFNVRGYDDNNDGVIDDIAIEFNKLTDGEIVPNVPYVIKAKSTGTLSFECSGKTLLAAPAEEGTVECSSTKMTYSFHGIYEIKNDLFQTGAYHLTGGAFHKAASDACVLSPNRFYLMVTPKTGGYNPSSMPQKIRMIVNGDDTTTGIENVQIDTENNGVYYDLTGRQVVNPTKGIYIHNGMKVYIK